MSAKTRIASHFAARRVPAISGAGIDPRREGEAMASHYLYARRVRRMSPAEALRTARELPAAYVSGAEYYESAGNAGAPYKHGSDMLRHFADTRAAGLRFIGDSEDMAGLRYNGWFTRDEDSGETLAGCVWALPGRKGEARLVYGYREKDGGRRGGEMNEGSGVVCVSHIVRVPMRGEFGNVDETDGGRDAARWGDSIAESVAEDERDYNERYAAGAEAAERDNAAAETRAELLPLLAELRAMRRDAVAGSVPTICATLRRNVDAMLESIREAREARDTSWRETPGYAEDGWKAGFMDMARGNGFVRAVRLGYAKTSDWRGAPESNPCNAGSN